MINQSETWIAKSRIKSKAIVTGKFGESYVSYLLSEKGIEVTKANTVGFDLFAIDSIGEIFPKREIVGISVKTRISKKTGSYKPTIALNPEKIARSAKRLNIDPWVAIVVGSKDEGPTAFIFPIEDLSKLRGNAKREDVVAVSELYDNPTGRVVRL
ncbi:MAG: hypothetical protein L6N96_04795 [Candidatus Methylarchaceae archaeon HK02M2]|nr:hypothetical protein [Candidatus Methylarchaceae archaeon HK02M2]